MPAAKPFDKDLPFAVVFCPTHGEMALTYQVYQEQLSELNMPWACPQCGAKSVYEDEKSEALQAEAFRLHPGLRKIAENDDQEIDLPPGYPFLPSDEAKAIRETSGIIEYEWQRFAKANFPNDENAREAASTIRRAFVSAYASFYTMLQTTKDMPDDLNAIRAELLREALGRAKATVHVFIIEDNNEQDDDDQTDKSNETLH